MDKQEKNILKFPQTETEKNLQDKFVDYIDRINFQLREPATNIFASLPLLAENINSQDTEKAIETLQSVYQKTYQIIKSVNNMSIGSKLLADREFLKEPVDFSGLVKGAFEGSKLVLPEYYKLSIEVETGCIVEGNAKLLTQAIFNLLVNSFDYRKEDNVQVSVSLKSVNNKCVLTYRDNSVGIKPELAQEVFKPYFAKNPYNDGEPCEKMGLGLYIAQQAVKHAGGTIFLQTEFSEGVNIVISIPEFDAAGTKVMKSSAKDFMLNKYSEMFIQLCEYCILPDLL